MTKKYVTIRELAQLTGFSVAQLRTLKDKRVIPHIRLGHRSMVFEPEKVRAALEKFEVKAIA